MKLEEIIKKKTKIVATIGPATESVAVLTELIESGLDVARLNFSHGDFAEHERRVENILLAVQNTGKTVALMQDLSGPKIRIGDFAAEQIELIPGEMFTLVREETVGDKNRAHINYPTLSEEVKVGGQILLDDGKKRLEVVKIDGTDVHCRVVVGGMIKGRRGVNIPGANLSIGALTEKDKKDLAFGLKHQVAYIALSFVRRPADITELRALLEKEGSDASIIAKIETPEAVDNIDEIIRLADGIMVARGDLSIEIPAETVPMIQKMIIKKCNAACKPVITATQMLESMINSPVPTRAEVSDIANAIIDGTDAIMLSEETALGKNPAEAVKVMSRVAKEIEKEHVQHRSVGHYSQTDIAHAVTGAVVKTADDVEAKLIFALTESGSTARMIARFRPRHPILAMTPNVRTFNKLALNYGCIPFLTPRFQTLEEAFELVRSHCLENNLLQEGDRVVVSAGTPFNSKNTPTNMLMVETI